MKSNGNYVLFVAVVSAMAFSFYGCDSKKIPSNQEVAEVKEVDVKHEKLLRHVVLFRYKADADPSKIREVEAAFAALPSKISSIHSFEWGIDVSVENLADGFTHCFLVTFKSEEDRANYLPHPEHQAFVSLLGPLLDKPLVIDYWTTN